MLLQYSITLILPSLSLPPQHAKVSSWSRRIQLFTSLKRFRDMLSDYRIFARLLAYPAIHTWAISSYAPDPSSSSSSTEKLGLSTLVSRSTPTWIEDLQILVNLAYQPLENVAYLASHNIIPPKLVSPSLQARLWLWSSRCWAAHVVLDLYKLYLQRTYLMSMSPQQQQTITQRERDEVAQTWVREVIINLAYAPLTIHWSLAGGLHGVDDTAIGALGVVAALGQLSKVW